MASVVGNDPINPGGGFWRELMRLPFRQFVIETSLSEAEVVERLRGIVEPGSAILAPLRRTNKLFAGEVSPQGFKFMRIIGYGNAALPVVSGSFARDASGTRVAVTMRPTRFFQVFGAVWLGFALLFVTITLVLSITLIFSSSKDGANPSANASMIFLGGLAVVSAGYLLMAGSFGFEARKARRILEDALNATPSARVQQILSGTAPTGLPKFWIVIGVVAAIGVIALFIAPMLLVRTEAYQIGVHYVRTAPAIQDELGTTRSVELERNGSNINYAGPASRAHFRLQIVGTRGTGEVFLNMTRPLGVWVVSSAELHEPGGRVTKLRVVSDGAPGAPRR
jgi:hypothetical protein